MAKHSDNLLILDIQVSHHEMGHFNKTIFKETIGLLPCFLTLIGLIFSSLSIPAK